MKTTDLIPIILYQLSDGDRYGYEIVKQIEDLSHGHIVIKQPTLYSLLKKLEQGKFISSYWQDSEIGGKRHYYKLTDNGRSQLSTYPPLMQLINDILKEDNIQINNSTTNIDTAVSPTQTRNDTKPIDNDLVQSLSSNVEQPKGISSEGILQASPSTNVLEDSVIENSVTNNNSPTDDIVTDTQPIIKPIDLTLNTSVPHSDEYQSNILSSSPTLNETSIDINEPSNSSSVEPISKQENTQPTKINIFDAIDFEASTPSNTFNSTSKEKIEEVQSTTISPLQSISDNSANFVETTLQEEENKIFDKLVPNQDLETKPTEETPIIFNDVEQIKFLNYVDLDIDKGAVKRKKAVSKHIQKMTLTCITLILMFAIVTYLGYKYSFTNVYYISLVIVALIIILYPILLLHSVSKLRLRYCSKPFKYSLKMDALIKITLLLSLIIVIFAYNLSIVNSIKDIFIVANSSNFLCPLLLSLTIIFDYIYSVIIYKRYTK